MRVLINPKYNKLSNFLNELPDKFEEIGTSIYKGRNEIKVVDIEGLKINIKSFKVPHLINKIAYAWLRGSKAKHSFEYAMKLKDLGVNTPEAVACVEVLKNGLFDRSYYISIHHEYDFTIRDLIGFEFEDKENILKQFAVFTSDKLHKNKVHHLDYSRGNILIKREGKNNYSYSIVDINRMRFEKMDYLKGLKNFSQIWADENELEVVAKEYARINHKDESEAVKMLIQFDKEHKAKINKKLALKKRLRK